MTETMASEPRRVTGEAARTTPVTAAAGVAHRGESPEFNLIERPAAGQVKIVDLAGMKHLKFGFSLDDCTVSILDVDVVLVFPDSGKIIMPAFMMQIITSTPPVLHFGTLNVDPQALIAAAGDIKLADQLPQLAISDNARHVETPLENPQQAPPVVQMPAAQSFANTPVPAQRPQNPEADTQGDALHDNSGRFLHSARGQDEPITSSRSEGSIAAVTQNSATTPATSTVAASTPDKAQSTQADVPPPPVEANTAPVITSNGGGASASVVDVENTSSIVRLTATDAEQGQNLVFSIAGGKDAALFAVNSVTGNLYFVNRPDFETPQSSTGTNDYDVQVAVSDGRAVDTQALTVRVLDVNEAPTQAVLGNSAIAENAANGTFVGQVVGSDPDVGSVLTYGFVSGGDAGGRFAISAATGNITVQNGTMLDHETSPNHVVLVQVTDQTGLSYQKPFVIAVTDVNEAPTITSNGAGSTAALAISENTTAVTTITAVDPDVGATQTYSITGGADAARFAINAATGALSFIAAPDFETPTDANGDNVYDVVVQVSDGILADTQTIAVTVTDANEPPVIVSDGGGATAALAMAENSMAAITTVQATDTDAFSSVNYAIVGGADAAKFTIDFTTGALRFNSTGQDYENPDDADANGVYEVIVRALDGVGGTDTQAISVTLVNANENPNITSDGGAATAFLYMTENSTAVTTVMASDPDLGAVLTYAIIGGGDAALFTIDPATGALSFTSAPDYENPVDVVFGDNVYDVIVEVSDGLGGSDVQSLQVQVNDQNEAPVIASNGGGAAAAISVSENTVAVTIVTATDPDAAATKTYSIIGGADAAKFTLNATTGALSFVTAPVFTSPTDVGTDNVYDVIVQASDGTLLDSQSIAITVTDQNDAPVITSNGGGGNAAVTVAENATAVTTVMATDPDAGATQTYSISGGADAARFTINAATGALSFVTAPNFEAPTDIGTNNVYDVVVQVSDGTLTDSQAIAVTVTNQNDAPVIIANGGGPTASVSAAENSVALVVDVTATDEDAGATWTYSIVGGVDAGKFTINTASGQIYFASGQNFEAPGDADTNGIYEVIVAASDGVGGVDTQAISVTLTNVNEAPVITSNGGAATAAISVAENGTAVTTVTATDPDAGASQTYSISGGADAAKFTINAATGALSFVTAPDFEAPTDAGANNVYNVVVRVSDGTLTDTQAIAVTVTGQNEAPVITSNGGGATASVFIVENSTAVTTITASDPDAGATQTYTITGGADAARFTINAVTGALSFVIAPDFNAPTDVGGNNVYDVVVQVTDGTLTDSQAIAVTVTDQNNPPVFTSPTSFSMVENGTSVGFVTATDPDAGAVLTYSLLPSGSDSYLFTIDPSTGALFFIAPPDYETPLDAINGDNIYDVRINVSDGTNSVVQDIFVTVTDMLGVTLNGDNTDNILTGTPENDMLNGLGGNDTLIGLASDDILNGGTGDDILRGGLGNDTLNGDGGTDTADYSDQSADLTISLLTQGVAQNTGAGNDTLNGITNLTGGSGNDTLSGDANNNLIQGGLGNDTIYGLGGNNEIYGGDGNDTIFLGALGTVHGGNGNDYIDAQTADGAFYGDDGNDYIIAGIQNNLEDGGNGFDIISFENSVTAVFVNVDANSYVGGDANGDTIINFEGYVGSNYNDTLSGSSIDEYFNGLAGNDQIYGEGGNDKLNGGSGNDRLDGGTGVDIADYSDQTADLMVNLNIQGVSQVTGAGTDTLVSIEDLFGGSGQDTLTGNAGNNSIRGGLGNDIINGGGGNDDLMGDDGNDTLSLSGGNGTAYGGAGDDLISVDAGTIASRNFYIDGGAGYDSIVVTNSGSFEDLDYLGRLTNMEYLDFEGAGVIADMSDTIASDITNVLGVSGPGNTLTVALDGNDIFNVAAGEFCSQAGNNYTFYSDAGLTNEIARVSIV